MTHFLQTIFDFCQTYSGAVTAIATVFIAIFTIVLALVTNWQAKLTKSAADAALLSAEAAIGVELPKLFVKKIDYVSGHRHLESTYDSVEVTITNYGRIPAFIFWESGEYRIGPALAPKPDYLNGVSREPGTVIHNGGEHKITARGADRTAVFIRAPFDKGEQTLWIYGIIYYRDFLSKSHSFQFCARLYSVRSEGETRIPRFIQDGPEGYANSV